MPMFSIATASTESAGREEKKRDAHDMRGCRLYIYESWLFARKSPLLSFWDKPEADI